MTTICPIMMHAIEIVRRESGEYDSGPEESDEEFYGYSDDEFPDASLIEEDDFPYDDFQEEQEWEGYSDDGYEESYKDALLEMFKLFFERVEKTEPHMTCFWYYRDNHCTKCEAYSGPEENRYPYSCQHCEKPLTNHEGYTMEYDDTILCNLCAAALEEDENW